MLIKYNIIHLSLLLIEEILITSLTSGIYTIIFGLIIVVFVIVGIIFVFGGIICHGLSYCYHFRSNLKNKNSYKVNQNDIIIPITQSQNINKGKITEI